MLPAYDMVVLLVSPDVDGTFNLVNEVDCTFDRYGHGCVSCSMRAGRVVVVCQIFYLVRIFVALALGVG